MAHNHSKKFSKAYLSTTVALAIGTKVSLGSLVLNHIYKGMNDLVTLENGNLNRMAKGSIGMVQIWLTVWYTSTFE